MSETATAGPAVEHASRGQGQHVLVVETGYSDGLLDPQRLAEAGTLLIQKPFTTDELLHAVHRALHPATLRG